MRYFWLTLFLIFCLVPSGKVFAQTQDSTSADSDKPVKKRYKDPRPRNATIRSAIIPGWGQIYNGKKSYWKVPIIYAAGGTIVGFFIYNNNQYLHFKNIVQDSIDANATVVNSDRLNRDQFRQWRDWNAFMLIGLYALNIVEANVTAHLKEFDVGENLSFNIKPYLYPHYITNKPVGGLCINFKFKK